MPEIITLVRCGLVVGLAIMVFGLAWLRLDAQENVSILRCFHGGEIVASAPVPAPPDFRVQMSAGSVTSAEWTLTTGQKVVMASTAPCGYLVTPPRPDERGAGNE